MRNRRVLTSTVIIGALALAACGGTKYGNGQLNGSGSGKAALGSDTWPSPSPSHAGTTLGSSQPPPPAAAPPPKAAAPPPPPKPQAQKFAIAIYSDTSGQPQFYPPAAKVYTGTVITFTNKDAVPRSVVSDSGAFNSGPIAPGATWNYTASTVGTFNYHDGTRPYAVAYFQVVNP